MKHTFSLSFSVFKIKQCGHNAPEVLCYRYISPVFSWTFSTGLLDN